MHVRGACPLAAFGTHPAHTKLRCLKRVPISNVYLKLTLKTISKGAEKAVVPKHMNDF